MALLATVCLLINAPARAQSVYGSVFGTVTDKTGAVVPGATVTVTDEAKGTVETVITNDSGDYNVSHLVPDNYDLKVEIKGFKSFVSKGIAVLADTAPRVDVALEVSGAGAETITVNADSVPVLKTDRSDVSTIFDAQQVSDLPIEGQNFTNLQLLLPGAQLLGWSHAADENPQASRQIQIDGQAFGGVAYELDGTDNQDPILGIIVVNPSLDSVTEAKITTQNFDAELGKAVSAVMTVQTKSGSNSFHGSAYDFRTGNANLARDPYSQCSGSYSLTHTCAIPPGLKNKFGGSIGGRVIKDKLFFFGAYEGQRQKVGTSEVNTLPSKNLTESCLGKIIGSGAGGIAGCDFSEYLNNLPGGPNSDSPSKFPQGKIYDLSKPFVTVDGVTQPQAFQNNVIPTGADNKVSKQFINLLTDLEPYVLEESGGSLGGLASNSNIGGTGLFNSDLWTTRVDDTISDKMNAFVRFSRWTDTLGGAQMYGAAGGPGFGIGGYGGQSTSADDSVAAGTDYVFSPTLVTDLRLGYLRYNIIDVKNDQSVEGANVLGIPGINLGTTSTAGSPGFAVASLPAGNQPLYGDGLSIARCNCPLTEREDQFQIVNNWTKTIGNHAIKIGADLRYGRNLRVPSDTDRAGLLQFSQGPTEFLSVPTAGAGQPTNYQGGLGFASFALGDVTTFGRYVSTSTNAKEFQKRFFFYAQDTWRASSKLTLNLGVRWEGYYPEAVNGKGNGALMDLKTGYLHVAGYGSVPTDMGWNLSVGRQFEPRLGVAYQLNPKTVIRAGYGRSFDLGVFGSIFGHVVTQNLPVLANQSINSTGTGQAFCLGSPSDNPGCNPGNNGTAEPATGGPVLYTPPAVPSSGLLPNPGYSVNTKTRPNPLQFPTLDAWNLSFQRALTPTLSLTIAYVGNKGTHTLGDGDSNNTNPNEAAIVLPGSMSYNGQTLHYDPHAPSTPNSGGATSNTNLLQRYYGAKLAACSDPTYQTPAGVPAGECGWTQGISNYGDNQNTNFNAMQVTLAQQQWKGLAATFNYQWAAAFDTNSGYFTWNPTAVYGRDSNVRQNAATAYGSYQLPFGKGKQFWGSANHATDLLIGGYEFSSTVSVSSGLPFTINANGCPNTPGSAPCYANAVGRLQTHLSSFQPGVGWTYYGDQSGNGRFTQPTLDQIGNAGRNTYWGPSFYNTDMSIQKSFAIWEKVEAKFRFDAYNAVNHIPPGNPGGNVIGATGGVITGEAPGPGPRQLEFSFRVAF
jgi:hypothetical protein